MQEANDYGSVSFLVSVPADGSWPIHPQFLVVVSDLCAGKQQQHPQLPVSNQDLLKNNAWSILYYIILSFKDSSASLCSSSIIYGSEEDDSVQDVVVSDIHVGQQQQQP